MAKKPQPRNRRAGGSKRAVALTLIVLLLIAGGYYAGYRAGVNSTRFKGSILLVNEANRLSPDYVPEGLVNLYKQRHSFRLASSEILMARNAYEAMERMFAAAEAEDMNGYIVTSGYRSYERQAEIYADSRDGYAQPPGASEHQTGLCFDVTVQTSGNFEDTPQCAWILRNAHKYGFIQRYPANKAHITGIVYEPWHYRYVGIEAATLIYNADITLEEFCERNGL